MLYSGSLSRQRSMYGTGLLSSGGKNTYFNNSGKFIQIHTSSQVHASTSFPAGYKAGTAILIPLIDGGISGRLQTSINTTADIIGRGLAQGTLTITISTSVSGDLLANIDGAATISITTSGVVTAYGYAEGTCEIGAQPDAEDIAQAVWQMQLPGGFSTGSAGKKLGDMSSSSDPWASILPGTYVGNEAGKILNDVKEIVRLLKTLKLGE